MRSLRRPIATILCGALIAACGFPTEDSSSPLAAEERPDLEPDTTNGSADETEEIIVWLIRDDTLVRRSREVASPLDVEQVVEVLGLGVTTEEAASGLRSAVPDDTMLTSATLSGGTAIVQLSRDFLDIAPGDQVLALGQVVMTLTYLRGVGRVRFEIDGDAVATPLPDGTSTEDSVSREDFRSLANAG